MIPREEEAANHLTTKQNNTINTKNPKPSKPNSSLTSTTTTTTTTTTKSSWSKFEDPRIVRVSKAHGGKDRHSKVCTVRGLRDRRVRLSVPTAIQLYDLQDRLGFNQPSKVVDWLLNAAKQEIDELPPLQIPQGFSFIGQNLHHHHHPIIPTPHHHQDLKISGNFDSHPLIKHPRSSATTSERNDDDDEEERERELHMENNQGSDHHHHQYVCTSNFVPRQNPSSSNSFVRWDSSNLTLSRPESTAHQHQDNLQNFSLVQPLSHHHHQNHQVVVYQHGMSTQLPYFSPQISPTNAVFGSKQPSFHGLELQNSSTHQAVRPFPFSMVSDLLPSQSKRDELHSSQP